MSARGGSLGDHQARFDNILGVPVPPVLGYNADPPACKLSLELPPQFGFRITAVGLDSV